MSLEKQLADTDSIYCTKVTNSNQSSIFISNIGEPELDVLFGENYRSNDIVRLRLDKRNLAFVAVSHVIDGRAWFKRKSSENWKIDAIWLGERLKTLEDAFDGDATVFLAQLNKDDHSTNRLYMKGMTSLTREDRKANIALRDYLFSGDVVVLTKLGNGDISFEVKIPDSPIQAHWPQNEKPVSLPAPANGASGTEKDRRLDSALKLFAEKRMEDGDGGWFKVGRDVNGRIREYFDSLTNEAIGAFDDAKIEELFCGRKDADGKIELETMWSGKPGMGWANIKPKSAQETQAVRDFLCKLKSDPGVMMTFRQSGFMRPAGFGPSVVSELLMKFHPELCIKHGEVSHKVLTWLGLIDSTWSREYSDGDYKQVCGAAAKIVARMSAMGIPRQIFADGTGDNTPPDYLTVNEFTWFVSENKDLIKEEVMKKQWKPVNSSAAKKSGTRKLSDAFANDEMLKRLAAALRTKPFAILAGHSGTGKSQLVRRLAYMTCNNELLIKEGEGKTAPGNYCMVQVKPNWHDSTDLIGYYSEMGGRHFVNTPFVQFVCKAYAYPDTPFFVCLDEMNLAPVEQYFAEYLSAIESLEKKGADWVTDPLVEVDKDGETIDPEILGQIMKGAESTEAAAWIQSHGLTIPKNLFVVGTVNMDETTCQFSRKVLDRAMTLLMNDVKFGSMSQSKKPSEEELLDDDGLNFFLEGKERGDVGEAESKLLDGINEPLANTAFVVAYRFANEYALYEAAWAKLTGVDLAPVEPVKKEELATKALDHVVLMKLLPRIHGERRVVEGIFKGRKVKGPDGDKDLPGLKAKVPDGLSAKMMDAILVRSDEYLTFWP